MTRRASFVNHNARCVIAVKLKVRHWCVMARDDPHFRLRLPAELKKRIEVAANRANRSINSEIVSALEEAYPEEASIEDLQNYLKMLVENYTDPNHRSAAVLKDIYDIIDTIRIKLAEEQEEADQRAADAYDD